MSQSNVKLFEKEEFGKVRVVMQGEDPWFVASDVAKALGYEKPNNAVNEHCKKMNKITLDPNLGGRVSPPFLRRLSKQSSSPSPTYTAS